MKHNDKQLEAEIKASLDQLDAITPSQPPHMHSFVTLVREHKNELRKQLIKDLITFWLISLVILFVVIVSFVQSILLYFVIQLVILISLSVPILYKRKKGVKA